MQQERGETEPLQKEQPTAPMQCPRCGSVDTKFRYYNNGDHAQPRHYCKTCRRYWTVGGSLRDVPIGGSRRNGEQIIVSSSIYSNSPLLSPPSISDEEWQNRSQYPTPMAAEVPQNFDTATIQLFGNLSASDSHSSSYRFDDDISCLAAIQSLIQPQVINESDDAGNHGNGSIDMASWEECNFQSMPPKQPTTQEIPSHSEISQINVQDHEVNAHYLSEDSLIHPLEPMNFFPQDFNNSFRFFTSNANLHNNSTGNTTDLQMARTSVDPNQWSNFPNYGPM